MSTTKIEWATKVWNPVTGCTKVSPGCRNCYAERFANRLKFNPKIKGKYSEGFKVQTHENELIMPMNWKKPERIFVCSMGDLFHEDVPFEFIRKVMDIIYHKPIHTFMILTKRPERMAEFFKWFNNPKLAVNFRNLWLGVSAENQEQAKKRIPILLNIRSRISFVSCEPLLSDIDLDWYLDLPFAYYKRLDWVIAGGETGSDVRPMHPEWIRSLRDQCKAALVPFFFKGWGNNMPVTVSFDGIEPVRSKHNTVWKNSKGETFELIGKDGDYLVAGYNHEDYQQIKWVSNKKLTGDYIDGKQYHEFPIIKT